MPDRKREYTIEDDDVGSLDSDFSAGRIDGSGIDEPIRFDKRNRRRGMLGWFKLRVSFLVNLFAVCLELSGIFCLQALLQGNMKLTIMKLMGVTH